MFKTQPMQGWVSRHLLDIPVTRLLLIIATFYYLILSIIIVGAFIDDRQDIYPLLAYHFSGSVIFYFITLKYGLKTYNSYVQEGRQKLHAMYAQAKAD